MIQVLLTLVYLPDNLAVRTCQLYFTFQLEELGTAFGGPYRYLNESLTLIEQCCVVKDI